MSWAQPAKHESEGQQIFVTIFNVVEVDMQRKDTTFLLKFAKQIEQHIHLGIIAERKCSAKHRTNSSVMCVFSPALWSTASRPEHLVAKRRKQWKS